MEDHSFLADVLVFLVAAVVVVPIFQRLRSSLILGYLAAGLAIGPHALGLVNNEAVTRALAELGVIFLLFTIGLELTIDRLRVIRRYIFGLGTVQVLVTGDKDLLDEAERSPIPILSPRAFMMLTRGGAL